MEWIVKVQEKHEEYVTFVRWLGEIVYAEDIVQEFYIKLIKYSNEEKALYDNKPNMVYLLKVLKSLFNDFIKQKKKIKKVDITEFALSVDYDYYETDDHSDFYLDIINEACNWQYFDKTLFELYTGIKDVNRSGLLSMRQISEGSDISTKTIFYSLKQSKNIIKEKFKERYFDYIVEINNKKVNSIKIDDLKNENYKDDGEHCN